ncbi:MAG: methyltransferase domain-containing protein [Myxococcaceae bacterium]|nr:methyltransferase domain-containing protein [Myxococcaceae bacterium]
MATTTLAEQYRAQEPWRSWDRALSLLPLKAGQRVFDLGCGTGQMSGRLHRAGCEVIGIDAHGELLDAARRDVPGVRFEQLDLRQLTPQMFGLVDGIWSSFTAAYFTRLEDTVQSWARCLAPKGWLALVEMEDLFGHEPLSTELKRDVRQFYEESRVAGRYDFMSGVRLAHAVREAGLRVVHHEALPDRELCFQGAASNDVLTAWQNRLARMGSLQSFFGARFSFFEQAFLSALRAAEHRSMTKVTLVVAVKLPSDLHKLSP